MTPEALLTNTCLVWQTLKTVTHNGHKSYQNICLRQLSGGDKRINF